MNAEDLSGERLQQLEREFLRDRILPKPRSELVQPILHWTELTDLPAGNRIATEWNYYRRNIGRFLAEGQEGRWALIKGEELIGIWDTEKEANDVRLQRFLMQDVLLKQILEREPIIRGGGYGPVRNFVSAGLGNRACSAVLGAGG